MTVLSPLDPQPSLEGGNYKPSNAVSAPIVNSVDQKGGGSSVRTKVGEDNTPIRRTVDWVGMARQAYEASESWLQVNQRHIWATSFAHYRSEHAPNSPILMDANKHRAKHFFPKTRTLVRAIQAAAASAYFTSSDVVELEAEDSENEAQVNGARFMKELVNYRLDQTIPWYLLVLGAVQEASVLGTVCSHQSWVYREEESLVSTEKDIVTGESYGMYETKVLEDKPQIRLVPAENLRISPAADWLDPANSSPYIIELLPMYLGDILTKIGEGKDSKSGEPAWKNIGEGMLISAGNRDNLDTTRRARSGTRRLDPKSNMMESVDEFRIIWIHRNIIRHGGKDWLYYTAGANVLLSDPVPLAEVIPWANGKRDYVLGKIEVETDRPYPSSPVELSSGMQKAVNELKNQRYDNVRQVLNRRYLYRAGNQVDVRALSRNVPGGLIGISAAGPLDNHVTPLATPDVTGSSYQEEDRLSLAMDDLTGSTTGSTVNSNRKLHETATGMNLMNEAGNQVREMELRTITETWMEPVLRQLVQLEAAYETNEVAMTVAAKKANILKVLPEYFDHKFIVSVKVGMGAVSPTQRIQKIQTAVATTVQLIPDASAAINGKEVAKEIFGAAGFDNGERFFNFDKVEQQKKNQQPDPQQEMAQQQLQAKVQADTNRHEIEQGKLQLANNKLELENQKMQAQFKELEAKINLLVAKTATEGVTAVFEATQAAGVVAQNPGISSTSDEILASVGFKDYNSAPVVQEVANPQPVIPPEDVSTHPGFPPQPAMPQSPASGIMKGIETPQIGGQG